MFNNHLMAWFFELTPDPNIEYEIALLYDVKELTVAKMQLLQIEPLTITGITKLWRGNPIVEEHLESVRNILELR